LDHFGEKLTFLPFFPFLKIKSPPCQSIVQTKTQESSGSTKRRHSILGFIAAMLYRNEKAKNIEQLKPMGKCCLLTGGELISSVW
jgi:hypothetical protein